MRSLFVQTSPPPFCPDLSAAMDCRGMGALMNAGKRPLGLVFGILEAQYAEEKAAWRRSREELVKEYMIYDLEWDDEFGELPHLIDARRAERLREIADMRALPGGRCVQKVGRGRCRGMSHRFAPIAFCSKHHSLQFKRLPEYY